MGEHLRKFRKAIDKTRKFGSLVFAAKMNLIVLALCACLGLSAALPVDDNLVNQIDDDDAEITSEDAWRIPGFGIFIRKLCTPGTRFCCYDGRETCCGGRAFGLFCTNDGCPTPEKGCDRLFGTLGK